jgi:hypothetical protein
MERLMLKRQNLEEIARFADMLSAMGTESRLRIMQLLLSPIQTAWLSARSAMSWKSPVPPYPIIRFEDPAALHGTEEERLSLFRRLRDEIREYLKVFPS